MGYLYKLIRFTKRTCLTCAINSISLYPLSRSRNLNFHMSCKHKQAEPLPSHRKQDPVLFQIQEFQHIFEYLPNPRETRFMTSTYAPREITRGCVGRTQRPRFDVSSLWLISRCVTNRSSRFAFGNFTREKERVGQAIWRGRGRFERGKFSTHDLSR